VKRKQSEGATVRRNNRMKQRRVEKKTVERQTEINSAFPKPKPMELAKLAAVLRPGFRPAEGLHVAMEFYVEAVFFLRELAPASEDDLVAKFGSQKRDRARRAEPLKERIAANWKDRLELDPKKGGEDADAVRQFLAKHGLHLKTAKGVVKNLRRYWRAGRVGSRQDNLRNLGAGFAPVDCSKRRKEDFRAYFR